jgi:hypothetical protein
VQEEWSFVDRDSGDLRALDIYAYMHLYDWKTKTRVRPQLDILIECKQSDLPYMFFTTVGKTRLPDFPRIGGLRQHEVVITTNDDPSSWTFSVIKALGLDSHPFQTAPPFCHTFSKCVRKGKDLELSGSDAYNGLVLPLTKAVQHFIVAERPGETAVYFDAHLVVGIGVLDAPMVSVEVKNGTPELTLIPWVRVLRHEYVDAGGWWQRNKMRVIDVVHKDFLSEYLEQHLLHFAEQFRKLAIKYNEELATGKAFAIGMGGDSWSRIEERPVPRPRGSSIKRTTGAIKKLLSRE